MTINLTYRYDTDHEFRIIVKMFEAFLEIGVPPDDLLEAAHYAVRLHRAKEQTPNGTD